MGLLREIETYLNEIKAAVPGINKVVIVTEKGQLTNYLNAIDSNDNNILLAVIPNFSNNSPVSGDSYKDTAFMDISVLTYTDYSALDQEAFIDSFDSTLEQIKLVKQKLLEDHLDQSCNLVRFLNPSSIITTDLYNLSQCNGWTITFSFDVPLW